MAEANPMISLEAMTFQTAHAALDQGFAAIAAGETAFDLGGVKACDSSGVALMLAWQRRAHAAGQKLTYLNVPQRLQRMVNLYDVAGLLPHS
jgi:phospholipid transport system transporter-binding protein